MSRINTVPKGLQAFLGNSNFGDNPSELSPVAAPTIDISDFLKVDQMRVYISGLILQNTPPIALDSLTVPDNELWFLAGVGVRGSASVANVSANVSFRVKQYPAHPDSTIGAEALLLELNNNYIGTSNDKYTMQWLPQPFPVPSACELYWYFDEESSAPVNWDWTTYLWYYALKV